MFRASTGGGATFGDKINLSNTTDPWMIFLYALKAPATGKVHSDV